MEFVAEKRSAKVAQYRCSKTAGLLDLPRDINDPSIHLLPRAGAGEFGLLEFFKRRVVAKAKHDVVGLDV